MTTVDLTLILFASCNALRIAAYFPQMLMLVRRPAAAATFSHPTWALFAAANLSTALYAAVAIGSAIVCVVHAFSALCCGVLIGLAIWRRRRFAGASDQAVAPHGLRKHAPLRKNPHGRKRRSAPAGGCVPPEIAGLMSTAGRGTSPAAQTRR